MLFDYEVLEFAEAHFVPVITDHPRGRTEPKRNPEMWELSETWKRSPNGSQLVWLVSADKSLRSGIVYSEYKDPAKLLAWMEAVAIFDGRVENPTAEQERIAVINHLRSELHAIWRSPNREEFDRKFHERGAAFDRDCDAVADDELCREADARARLERYRHPSAERRAELRAALGRLVAIAREAKLGEKGWFSHFASLHDADQLGGESTHAAAIALMRSWLAAQIEAGELEVDRELAALLNELGVRAEKRNRRK